LNDRCGSKNKRKFKEEIMLRSLYSGISGMRVNQLKMDTIGNNIANAGTTGFKTEKVTFQDALNQTIANAQAPSANSLGGLNSQQVGFGVKTGSIGKMMSDGTMQNTNRNLDFAIEGSGFFTVSQDAAGKAQLFTRDGAFYRDSQGNLVNAGGLRVMGYVPTGYDPANPGKADTYKQPGSTTLTTGNDLKPLNIPNTITVTVNGVQQTLDMKSFSVDGSGKIIGIFSDGNQYLLGQATISKFINPEGLDKVGGNNYTVSNNSGTPQYGVAGGAGFGTVRQGVLEMSNVDLANEFTEMIVTSRSYQANSKIITTSDEMLQELINLKR
jgi:flagellar hook protein FlgE